MNSTIICAMKVLVRDCTKAQARYAKEAMKHVGVYSLNVTFMAHLVGVPLLSSGLQLYRP